MKIYPAPNCQIPAIRCTWGNFNQGGDKASFGSSGNFVIAFMGSGQTAHIDDVGYSRFANIDPDHSSVKMKDEPLVFVANMGISIGKGVVSGLQEALGDLELSAAAVTAIGVSLSALSSPGVAAVVSIITLIAGVIGTIQSLFMIAQAAGGIYSTATGTGTVYDKAEAFAHDFIIMVVGIVSLVGSVKAIQSSLAAFKSAAQELFGRKSRLTPSEVTQTFQGTKLITSFEEFTEYTKGYLDDDALQYVKEVLNKDADDIAKLKKIAQLVEDGSRKIGKKLSKEELKAGLDAFWDDAGVEGALAAIERHYKWANTYSGYEAPKITTNAKGDLTNGKYTVNAKKMMPHLDGTAGKSRFLYDIDAHKAVLDASAYADEFNLWKPSTGNPADFKNKAKIYVENGPVGVTGNGELTNYINVYRTKAGTVHGCPGNP